MKAKDEGSAPIRTMIGGQAVLEGLMMMGPSKTALAVRQSNGNIQLEYMSTAKTAPKAASIPFVRGSVRLFRQMVIGVKALLRSADLLEEAEQEKLPETETSGEAAEEGSDITDSAGVVSDVPTVPADDSKSTGSSNLAIYASAAVGILIGIGMFMLLPNLLTGLIKQLTSLGSVKGFGSTLLLNLIEGVIRITLFVAYVALTSMQKDIRRVWMYHGAEHKTIACYEKGLPLTVENIRSFSPRHPRCGTAFLFVVMIVSILLFTFAGWYSGIINILIRFALVPLVAGIAFEIIRWSGRHDNALSRLVAMPGLAMQRLTTREPDDDMIEVAIRAMEAVIPETPRQDEW